MKSQEKPFLEHFLQPQFCISLFFFIFEVEKVFFDQKIILYGKEKRFKTCY